MIFYSDISSKEHATRERHPKFTLVLSVIQVTKKFLVYCEFNNQTNKKTNQQLELIEFKLSTFHLVPFDWPCWGGGGGGSGEGIDRQCYCFYFRIEHLNTIFRPGDGNINSQNFKSSNAGGCRSRGGGGGGGDC